MVDISDSLDQAVSSLLLLQATSASMCQWDWMENVCKFLSFVNVILDNLIFVSREGKIRLPQFSCQILAVSIFLSLKFDYILSKNFFGIFLGRLSKESALFVVGNLSIPNCFVTDSMHTADRFAGCLGDAKPRLHFATDK